MAYGGLLFPATGCPVPVVDNSMIYSMYALMLLHLFTSLGCLCPRTFFLKNGWDQLSRTFFMSDLHIKRRIISRSVSIVATDSSCCVWDRGWTTCLLCGGPIIFFLFLNVNWCVSLIWWKGIFHWCFAFIFLYIILLWNSLYILATLFCHIP